MDVVLERVQKRPNKNAGEWEQESLIIEVIFQINATS